MAEQPRLSKEQERKIIQEIKDVCWALGGTWRQSSRQEAHGYWGFPLKSAELLLLTPIQAGNTQIDAEDDAIYFILRLSVRRLKPWRTKYLGYLTLDSLEDIEKNIRGAFAILQEIATASPRCDACRYTMLPGAVKGSSEELVWECFAADKRPHATKSMDPDLQTKIRTLMLI